jgi:hypothetical protein
MKFNNLKIDCWFPTTIGVVDYPSFNKDKYLSYILSKKTNDGFNTVNDKSDIEKIKSLGT